MPPPPASGKKITKSIEQKSKPQHKEEEKYRNRINIKKIHIDNWLRHIKDVYRFHQEKIDALENEADKFKLLCELNVVEQVSNVCHTTIVQNAWKAGQQLAVHGWIYGLENGIIKDLDVCITGLDEISRIHRLK